MKKKYMLILLVFLLTVGFASVSTTLVMNGTIGVAHKKSDFNVIFTRASVTGSTVAKATISENKKTITFETDKLSVVGDSAELVYKVKNDSTQYDANVTVSCTGGNSGYINVVSEFAGKSLPLTTPELMKAQEVRMGKMSVSLTKAYDASVTKAPITCTLEVEGEERDSIVEYSKCEYLDGTEWTFDYTGNEQKFEAPCDGEYKLETWGAQGGYSSGNTIINFGGYSVGAINLNFNSSLYINVGGKGIPATNDNNGGGYNGGGHGTTINQPGSGGGGATHIATKSGILSSLKNFISNIVIVSGGGGGQGVNILDSHESGGAGGGYLGVTGGYYHNLDWSFYGTGGSQSSGGVCYLYGSYLSESGSFGSFGQGGRHGYEAGTNAGGSGGGGGFYGGGGSSRSHGQAGGGSGYIGNPLLTNKVMYCYNCATSNEESTKTISTTCTSSNPTPNCAKQGDGYAKITLINAK